MVEHCALRLDILYSLGYKVDKNLPWYSTFSRTHQLYPAAVFNDHVFAQCVAVGLVTGHTQAVNSAFVKATASLERLCEKQSADVPPLLQLASKVEVEIPLAPPAALRASPEHHLRRVAAAYARHDSGPLGRD